MIRETVANLTARMAPTFFLTSPFSKQNGSPQRNEPTSDNMRDCFLPAV
jgi:hypothetical protein